MQIPNPHIPKGRGGTREEVLKCSSNWGAACRSRVERWAWFLLPQVPEEFEIMTTSKVSYWEKSPEVIAKRLAEEVEVARLTHQHLLNSAFKHGKASGVAESYLAEVAAMLDKETLGEVAYNAAITNAHRFVIHKVCEILEVAIDTPTLEQLNGLELPQLIEVKDLLIRRGHWPEWMYQPEA